MEGCGMKCCKCLMFIFNAIFWLAGLALIIVAVVLLVNSNTFTLSGNDVLKEVGGFKNSAWVLLACGGLVFIIGMFGCCGAARESKCCLYMFAISVIILFIIEITGAILALVYKDKLEAIFSEGYRKVAHNYSLSNKAEKIAIDSFFGLQKQFKCCGGYNSTDYKGGKIEASLLASNNTNLPDSCCVSATAADKNNCLTAKAVYWSTGAGKDVKGCGYAIPQFLKDKAIILGAFGLVVIFIQILGVVLACCLISNIGKYEEVA